MVARRVPHCCVLAVLLQGPPCRAGREWHHRRRHCPAVYPRLLPLLGPAGHPLPCPSVPAEHTADARRTEGALQRGRACHAIMPEVAAEPARAEPPAAGVHVGSPLLPAHQVAVVKFLDFLATPPGWPLRCLLAERRKDRARSFPPEHVDFTASSGGLLPWAFGAPRGGEPGIIHAANQMLRAGGHYSLKLGRCAHMHVQL